MKNRLVLRIENEVGYNLILDDSKKNIFKGFIDSNWDSITKVGHIYFDMENEIVFSEDYLNQLLYCGCHKEDISQNIVFILM
ncbi:hypothetical protein RFY44_05730 [Acinetobacter bereziniae]|uniref:hypothetical protein n=1 Tax=Acinetobacter bereziniae TaxID=106648 RepID=UPI002813EC8D|nr:hypothetical protein [Acinetobacter bereziniae]MDQ9818380.1 hypothetical protein [Acinetobacter bereziniae]